MPDPVINAASLMTGHIYLNGGILARVQNESQLAFVLAHEISHVYHRDALYHFENARRKKKVYETMSLVLLPGGALSELTLDLAFGASLQGYGRESETAADLFALDAMTQTGYDPRQAVDFFNLLMEEKEQYRKGREVFFLSSHPSNQARKDEVEKWLAIHSGEINTFRDASERRGRFQKVMHLLRRENVRWDMELGRWFHALQGINAVIESNQRDPVAFYYRGEIYRIFPVERAKIKQELTPARWKSLEKRNPIEQDLEWYQKAAESYQEALRLDPDYALAQKGIGRAYYHLKEYAKAREAFEKYIMANPQAKDQSIVMGYLTQVEEALAKQA
jgi:predicted Zn-dependent protease